MERISSPLGGVYWATDRRTVVFDIEARSDDIAKDGFVGTFTCLVGGP